MSIVLNLVLFLLAWPAVACCLYLLLLTLLSARNVAPPPSSRRLRFDLFIPAHNESARVTRTIASLRALDWPAEQFRITVIADNCNDDTAAIARAAGASVLVRDEPTRRGKGYALRLAFSASRLEQWADAVVVVDADAEVSRNLLEAFAARIEAGEQAVQAHYGVLNPMDSWRTRLITIAKGAFHIVRSRARERLRLSAGIRGNGWCVTHALLAQAHYEAFSLTEDIEYGIAVGLAGYRVAYADEAHADADMVSNADLARRQRQRWEGGRFQLIRSRTGELLSAAIRQRSLLCLDLGFDLLVLPLSYVMLSVVVLALLAATGHALQLTASLWLWIAAGCFASLALYVFRGWQLSGIGLKGVLDLARVPWFVLWRLWSMIQRQQSKEWVRTGRE